MPSATMTPPKNQKAIEEIRTAAKRRKSELETNTLSPTDASQATGLHVKTIRKAIKTKRLTANNEGTRLRPRYRIHKDDLMSFMKLGETAKVSRK